MNQFEIKIVYILETSYGEEVGNSSAMTNHKFLGSKNNVSQNTYISNKILFFLLLLLLIIFFVSHLCLEIQKKELLILTKNRNSILITA